MGLDGESVDRCIQRARREPFTGQGQQLRGIAAGAGETDRKARGGAAVMLETQRIALHGPIARAQESLQSCEQGLQRKKQRGGVGDRARELPWAWEKTGPP